LLAMANKWLLGNMLEENIGLALLACRDLGCEYPCFHSNQVQASNHQLQ